MIPEQKHVRMDMDAFHKTLDELIAHPDPMRAMTGRGLKAILPNAITFFIEERASAHLAKMEVSAFASMMANTIGNVVSNIINSALIDEPCDCCKAKFAFDIHSVMQMNFESLMTGFLDPETIFDMRVSDPITATHEAPDATQ